MRKLIIIISGHFVVYSRHKSQFRMPRRKLSIQSALRHSLLFILSRFAIPIRNIESSNDYQCHKSIKNYSLHYLDPLSSFKPNRPKKTPEIRAKISTVTNATAIQAAPAITQYADQYRRSSGDFPKSLNLLSRDIAFSPV